MSKKCYVTVWAIQEDEIKHWCFDNCGKVIFSLLIDDELGGLSHCWESDCPHLDKEMDEPFGEVQGNNAYMRKLKDLPEAAVSSLTTRGADRAIAPEKPRELDKRGYYKDVLSR